MTRHIVITGGAGFIGSHLVDAYLARGWRVSVIDDLSSGRRENVDPRAELHVMDIRESADLLRTLRPDVVSHHAAQISVRDSVADPGRDAEINVVASLKLLEASVEAGVGRFQFASTGGAIYGEPQRVPQDEDHPARPMSPYGCAKLSVEHYLDYYRHIRGLSTVALRYANVYGPRQNAHGEAGVVAIFIDRLLRNETAIINGDGEQTRDFVHVHDVVAANLAVTDRTDLTGAWNVGTGIETSVNDLYALLAAAFGSKAGALHGPAKVGEQVRSVIDRRRLARSAALPDPLLLAEGLATTVAWFREQKHSA